MNNIAICEKDLLGSTTQNSKNVEIELTRREVIEELEFAWLAGFFDGEGCLSTLIVYDKRRNPPIPFLRIVLTVSSNTPIVLEKCKDIFSRIGVRAHLVLHKRKSRQFYTGNLTVVGNRNLSEAILRLLPYLVLKKDQAILVLQMIKRKLDLSRDTEGKKGQTLTSDPLLLSWTKKLSELKQVGKFDNPSTTTRCAPQTEDDDIVSSATEMCS